MSREIRFRAWMKNNDFPEGHLYVIDDRPNFLINFNGDLVQTYPDGKAVFARIGNSECVLMQYTGLKDKNGKEIYEGDVVRCASSKRCPHEVVWMLEIPSTNLGGAPGFYLKGLNEGYAFGGEEVIGNIYENPELIKTV